MCKVMVVLVKVASVMSTQTPSSPNCVMIERECLTDACSVDCSSNSLSSSSICTKQDRHHSHALSYFPLPHLAIHISLTNILPLLSPEHSCLSPSHTHIPISHYSQLPRSPSHHLHQPTPLIHTYNTHTHAHTHTNMHT